MFANYLIGLREGLEAALVVSILVAYLVKSDRRQLLPRIWTGVAIAVAISLSFGALLTFGPRGLTFEAQELIGGTLSIVAVCFVTWMVFWMAGAARSLSGKLRRQLDDAADRGGLSLTVVALLAVGREGLETALFLWAATQATTSGTHSTTKPLVGAALGIATAVAIAYAIYRGALKLNLNLFFTWTGAFLILVAAGVFSYGIHDLQEAAFLPGLHNLAFDVSNAVPPSSWYGTILKGTLNFSPATTKLELAGWLLYAIPTMTLFFVKKSRSPGKPAPARPVQASERVSP